MAPSTTFPPHTLAQVDVRDTVGCGDSFAAAVVLGYCRQHSIPAVMALANAVGAGDGGRCVSHAFVLAREGTAVLKVCSAQAVLYPASLSLSSCTYPRLLAGGRRHRDGHRRGAQRGHR